jgi:hypothetical protein
MQVCSFPFIALIIGHAGDYQFATFFICHCFVAPIIHFSTYGMTLFVAALANTTTLLIVWPIMNEEALGLDVVGWCLALLLVQATFLFKYDEMLVHHYWSSIREELRNAELYQVLNTSKQGILIYSK